MKPWLKQQWCIPEVSGEFVWRMEDVLDLSAEPYDEQRLQVCCDERPCQLSSDKHEPLPPQPG